MQLWLSSCLRIPEAIAEAEASVIETGARLLCLETAALVKTHAVKMAIETQDFPVHAYPEFEYMVELLVREPWHGFCPL